jgi:tight adherence protein B
VTAALLSAALAVLLWPDRRVQHARRAALVSGSPTARVRRLPGIDEFPVPMIAAIAGAGAAAVVSTPLVAALAGILVLAGARSWAAAATGRAAEGRLAGFAEGLGALVAELRGGRPVEAATTAAVAACGNEASGRALTLAIRARQAGDPVAAGSPECGDALVAVAGRVSAAVRLSARTGCSLADVLTAVDDDLRARAGHRRELRSAMAGPRASALLLAGLPVLGLAMGGGIGADPWRVLTATGAGQVLLVVGVAFELAGLAWSRRLVERALR